MAQPLQLSPHGRTITGFQGRWLYRFSLRPDGAGFVANPPDQYGLVADLRAAGQIDPECAE
jgi:hypothetical protein